MLVNVGLLEVLKYWSKLDRKLKLELATTPSDIFSAFIPARVFISLSVMSEIVFKSASIVLLVSVWATFSRTNEVAVAKLAGKSRINPPTLPRFRLRILIYFVWLVWSSISRIPCRYALFIVILAF